MSFREIRETTEILRTLGFPRLVSIENFRYPNFPLMAEILEWTVRKFDPIARFPKQIDSEQDRVIFVKSAVLTLLQKAHIRLNPKNVYQSDGHAIRELLPLLKMPYDSVKEQQKGPQKGEQDEVQISALRAQVNATRKELRQAVQMATELPKTGANLYEFLRDEIFAKDIRNKALNNSLNASQIEKEIRERIQTTEQRIVETKERLANIGNDEQELAKKIERRKRELDQLQKRLAKLQSFRPPYMDEYERYEKELKEQYAIYVVFFRNLHYLQQQLAHAEQMEREQAINAEQSMRVAVEKMRLESEQSAPVIAGIQMDGAEIEDDEEDRKQSKEVRVFGNMTGAGLSDEEEEDDDDEAGGHIIEVEDEEEEEGDEHMLKQHMEEEFDEERHRSEEENSLNDF